MLRKFILQMIILVVFVLLFMGCKQVIISPGNNINTIEETNTELDKSSEMDSPQKCPPYFDENSKQIVSVSFESDLMGMLSDDFNDDGYSDILLVRGYPLTQKEAPIELLLGDNNGNFIIGTDKVFPGYPGTAPLSIVPREVVIADFNGDSRSDIFIADHGIDVAPSPGAQNTLVLSGPNGTMMDATNKLPQAIDWTHSAAAADIDQDGDVDLFIGNIWGPQGIPPTIYINTDGEGSFKKVTGRLPYPIEDMDFGAFTTSEFSDVNNDGFPDLILGDAGDDLEGGTSSHVLMNDGNGYFSYITNAIPAKLWDESDLALDIKSSDINKDGFQDLFILFTNQNYSGRYIQVLINNHDGTFIDETIDRLPQSKNTSPWYVFIDLIDVNNDSALDIVCYPSIGNTDSVVFFNDGNGNFMKVDDPFDIHSEFFALNDINNDDYKELVFVELLPEEKYYLKWSNRCP